MKAKLFCISLIAFLTSRSIAVVNYSNSTFTITLPYVQTLKIGSETTPVFFETKNEKYCIQGEPSAILKSDAVYSFEWLFKNDQRIKLNFIKQSNSYKIELQTTGTEDITKWGLSLTAINNVHGSPASKKQ
jgi:hypothetical protein